MKKITAILISLILGISVIGQTPVITMTTSTTFGSSISFLLSALAENTPIQIDFGDGVKMDKTIGTNSTTIGGTIGNSQTIKIYGTGITLLDCPLNILIALDVTRATELTDLSCDDNNIKELDVTKNTALRTLFCNSNNISSLDITKNKALISLSCYGNNLTTIDLTQNTELTYLFIGTNELKALDVSKNTKLKTLICYRMNLSQLDITANPLITRLSCEENRLPFSSIPIKQVNYARYEYAPQSAILITKNITVGAVLDLSSEYSINGTTTIYTWRTKGGTTLTNGTDYTITNGKTTFLKVLSDSVYCEMTNATFPDLRGSNALKTTNVKVKTLEPAITMTTAKAIGTTISLSLGANANNTPIQIDFGNGTLVNYTLGTIVINITGSLTGSQTVKIYGTGIVHLDCVNNELTALDINKNTEMQLLSCSMNKLTALNLIKNTALTILGCYENNLSVLDITKNTLLKEVFCYENNLTTLDVSKNIELERLGCDDNHLTNLDVSKNLKLETLYCRTNQLTSIDVSKNAKLIQFYCYLNNLTFATLPVQAQWTYYQYASQRPIPIAKSIKANTIMDLSSQYSVNGKTTVCTWKTKSGTILTNGTDYTITNGKTTFLKVLSDSVYCEMTNATFPDFATYPLKTTCIKVLKASQTITFNILPAKKTNDIPFTISASANSGLAVTFESSDPSIASISGNTVTIIKAGSVTITAAQAGDDLWGAAISVEQTLTISKQSQSITFNALPAKKANDAAFIISASASSGIAVTFTSSDPSVASVNGNTVTLKKIGTVKITASQTGDDSWSPAASVSQTLIISKINQTITFEALPAKKISDDAFSISAAASSGLAVTFTSSDPSIASVSGNTITLKKTGTISITASQDGDDTWNAVSAIQKLVITAVQITAQAQTITFNALPNKSANDAPFTISATASSGLAVNFTSSDPSIASVIGNTVTIIKAGTVTITADQVGDNTWAPAASVSQTLTIGKQAQTITFNTLPVKKTTDASFELSASASSALAVTFTNSDPSVASISGSTVTILKAGTITITASQAGNESWNSATAEQTLTITSVTGIGEEKKVELIVYPNPATDMLHFKGEGSENMNVSIFNLTGANVWSGMVKEQRVTISQLPAGVYILKISNNKENQIIRFVKQ